MEIKTVVIDLANKFPHPIPQVHADEIAALAGTYVPLDKPSHEDWRGVEREDFIPSARQLQAITAVRVCLNEGLFYTVDVLARFIELLGIPPAVSGSRREKVEGGEVGMDAYYARKYVEAQATYMAERAAAAKMALVVGSKLGTIRLSDMKRYTSLVVESVLPTGMHFRLTGKRGSTGIAVEMTALAIQRAIDRAFDAKQRKDNSAMLWA